ncbi:MAG: metal ABC transporter solute-binding protein, Zn/Mn family, partial [Stenotrophomonas sp.]
VPLIPAGFNPHAYEPRAEDIKRISGLDVVVLNGVGHDDFADRMIAAQASREARLALADDVVVNDGQPEHLQAKVEALDRLYRELAAKRLADHR